MSDHSEPHENYHRPEHTARWNTGQLPSPVEALPVGMVGVAVVVGPMREHGRIPHPAARAVVYASDSLAETAADLQFVHGCGPHLAAITDGLPRRTCAHPDPWPLLSSDLATLGVGCVYAYPIRAYPGSAPSEPVLGALQLHSITTGPAPIARTLTAAALAADHLAPVIATYLAKLGREPRLNCDDHTVYGYDEGVVKRAIGVLMARDGTGVHQASSALRAAAYAGGITSTAAAHRIIDSLGTSRP